MSSNLTPCDLVAHSLNNLRNIILCEDIRTEVGNKLSLMGIFSGDVVVTEIPATIHLAVYMQYIASPEETGELSFEFRLYARRC